MITKTAMKSSGSASIFYKDYGGSVDSWGQQAKQTASNHADYFLFGSSVSISGDYAVVGSPWCLSRGSAYIFYKDQGGTDNWGEQAVLTASDAAYDDYFGSSVSISGNYVFSGAPGVDNGGSGSGAAYIFVRSGSSWSQQSKLTPSDPSSSAGFGNSASVRGDYAIIGASGENSFKGSAYIYHRSGTMWTQQAKLTASDGAGSDRYGNSVTISSDYALVGANHDGDGGSFSGSAYFYLDEPTISSPNAQVTGFSSAVLGATNYIGWKGGSVLGRGVVWSTDAAPTLSDYTMAKHRPVMKTANSTFSCHGTSCGHHIPLPRLRHHLPRHRLHRRRDLHHLGGIDAQHNRSDLLGDLEQRRNARRRSN